MEAHFREVCQEVSFEFTKSSGPGGQHINRTESKVVLRWPLTETLVFTGADLARLKRKLKLNRSGELVISSERHRSRKRNQEDCIEKLKEVLTKALFVPPRRKKTLVPASAKRKRLGDKSRRGELKKLRRSVEE